jgi:SAM-dependent methyltransferase
VDKPDFMGVPRVSEEVKAVTPDWEALRVVQCAQCGFYYIDPMPFWDDKDLQALYDVRYFGDESPWWHCVRKEVDPLRRLDAIEEEIEASAPKLLDIGCGQGYVLEHALQRGWNGYGLEGSREWAQKTAARLGVQVYSQRVEDADLPEKWFDVVFSDSVIEHLPDPAVMMKMAWRVLKPGGVAYFVTPNADALVNHFRGMAFQLVGSRRSPFIDPLCSPYHVVGFTPRSIAALAKRSGFEVRHLWVRHGGDEWRKEKKWSVSKWKSLMLFPVLLVGELMGMGTTIDILLIRP